MIVECPQCSTKFRLDDTKIPSKGVKVRCSKCKHVFNVTKPGDPPAESSPPPREQQHTPPPPTEPESKTESPFGDDTFDFKEDTPEPSVDKISFDDGLGDLSFDDKPAEEAPPQPPSDDFDFDDDFDFNDENQSASPEPPATTQPTPSSSAPEEPAAGADDDFGDFDFDDEPPAASSEPAPPPDTGDFGGDDFDFDDFSDSKSSAPEAAGDADISDDFGEDDFEFDNGGPPTGGGDALAGDDIQEFGDISFDDVSGPAESSPDEGLGLDDKGEEEFLFDSSPGGGGIDMAEDSAPVPPPPKKKRKDRDSHDDLEADIGGSDMVDDIPVHHASDEEPPGMAGETRQTARKERKPAGPKSKKSYGKVIKILIVLAVLGGGYFYLDSSGKLTKIKEIKISELNVDKIKILVGLKEPEKPKDVFVIPPIKSSDFYKVNRDDGETFWVLKGTVTNYYENSQWRILLEGKIKDGDEIKTAQAMQGNVLPGDVLKSASIKNIQKALMAVEDANLNSKILLSDESADFMIIFTDVESDAPKLVQPNPVSVVSHEAL